MDLCQEVLKNRKSHTDMLCENIVKYIQDNYKDASLSRGELASYLNISESYLSRFFSEHIGDSFAAYVCKTRINKAKELLQDNSLALSQIASSTGFNSENVFIRSFKRIHGITPGKYRLIERD
jgi:two-component system, response regulator YesN